MEIKVGKVIINVNDVQLKRKRVFFESPMVEVKKLN